MKQCFGNPANAAQQRGKNDSPYDLFFGRPQIPSYKTEQKQYVANTANAVLVKGAEIFLLDSFRLVIGRVGAAKPHATNAAIAQREETNLQKHGPQGISQAPKNEK